MSNTKKGSTKQTKSNTNAMVTNKDKCNTLLQAKKRREKRNKSETNRMYSLWIQRHVLKHLLFWGKFSLQVKEESRVYQAPLRCMAYVLHAPFKEELEHLKNNILLYLWVLMLHQSGTALYWCQTHIHESMIILKSSKVKSSTNKINIHRLKCQDKYTNAEQSKTFSRLMNVWYLTVKDAS